MRSLIFIKKQSGWKGLEGDKKKTITNNGKPRVVLASFPRSGNTFLRNILLDVFDIYSWNNINVYDKALKEYNRLYMLRKQRSIGTAGEQKFSQLKEQLAYPVIKTHELPGNILPLCNPDTKTIYLLRDGRDALVSMAHHRKDIIKPGSNFTANLKEALWAPMGSYFGGWGKNVTQWTEIADMVIHFEKLVENPEKEIQRLQKLLNLPDPKLENIPTFSSQREGGSHFGGAKRKRLSKEEQDDFNQRFFRSGKAGEWKNEMPEELQNKYWKKYGDVMLKMGYTKDGTLLKKNSIELISIHIPKTAGSSFFQLLKKIYGKQSVLKINTLNKKNKDLSSYFPPSSVESDHKIIHGHIKINEIKDLIEETKPKIITWLRDPTERVISNYYFDMQRIREGKEPAKISIVNYSLLEYASLEENRNMATKFLKGILAEDLYFIGLYEQFDDDINHLKNKLGWPDKIKLPHRKSGSSYKNNNDCKTQYDDITPEMREEISQLNSLDEELYQKIKKMRGIG